MSIEWGDLGARLVPYPHLRSTLGDRWVQEQNLVDPVLSRFALARWLRIDGFAPDLTSLDAVLARLADVPGIADRKRRLRSDPSAFTETLTELYFAAWLRDLGYAFTMPPAGADFAIELGGDHPLRAEVASPRKAGWADDLFVRLDLVAKRTGFTAELDHELESLPDRAMADRIVDGVVRGALAALAPADSPPPREPFVQRHPEAELTITWTPDPHPRISALTSPGPTTPWSAWGWVATAARQKAEAAVATETTTTTGQLPVGEAAVLVVGTRQLPTGAWTHFVSALRHYPEANLPLDWTDVPPQVAFIVLYAFEARRVTPFEVVCLPNPLAQPAPGPEATAFVDRLCPHPLRPSEAG